MGDSLYSTAACDAPSPQQEKGADHVEAEHAAVHAGNSQLRRLRLVGDEASRWRAAVKGARRRFFLPLAIALAACRSGDPFTLRIAVVGPFDPVGPTITNPYSLLVADLSYETPLVWNDQGEPSPRLACAWRPLPAGHAWIELDPQRRFWDGSPVTLEDVTASLSAAGLSSTPMQGGLDVAPAVPGVPAELTLTRTVIFRKASNETIGSGRFILIRQDRDRLVLRRVKPEPHRIATVEFVAYPDLTAAVAAVLRGDCNAHLFLAPRTSELLDGLTNLQFVVGPAIQRTAILFNHKTLSKTDRDLFMRAFRAADMESIAAERDRKAQHPVAIDPGRPLSILTWNADRVTQRLALAVRSALSPRSASITVLAPPATLRALEAGQFDLAVIPVLAWPQSEALAFWHTGAFFSPTGYSNPTLDAAIEARDWGAASRAFDLEPPGLFLGPRERLVVVDSRIRDARLGHNGVFELLPSWAVP